MITNAINPITPSKTTPIKCACEFTTSHKPVVIPTAASRRLFCFARGWDRSRFVNARAKKRRRFGRAEEDPRRSEQQCLLRILRLVLYYITFLRSFGSLCWQRCQNVSIAIQTNRRIASAISCFKQGGRD
ncbi:hypothetical protein L596_030327 [Steinernema carpocapsae]|uniref:Uncharacterized protein n=1 Tax=Steinernema carpocapsae TaxID=34508 RepID=A0A4U5LP29_STECR|nr:hypothetical protein L596_030327 [Steinernema carpocapsae]